MLVYYFRRSVKNQRKATHKKWKLKEGSQYEDYALIAALAKTVTYIDSLRGTVTCYNIYNDNYGS